MKSEESFMTNLTKFYVLTTLSEKPAHGYEIMSRLENATGKKPSAGQIYPLLKALEDKRLVKTRVTRTGKRSRKVYALTLEGRAFSQSLLERFSNLVDIAVKPRLSVCAHCGCNVYNGGFEKTVRGKKRAFCCKYCAMHY